MTYGPIMPINISHLNRPTTVFDTRRQARRYCDARNTGSLGGCNRDLCGEDETEYERVGFLSAAEVIRTRNPRKREKPYSYGKRTEAIRFFSYSFRVSTG